VREYSTREVAEISSLPAPQIRRWARAGLVTPTKDEGGHWRFSFQDLALLRTAGKLLEARVSSARVTRTLHELREQLSSRPLSAVSLVVAGGRVIVRDRMASWVLESRQGVFGFEMDVRGFGPASGAEATALSPTAGSPQLRAGDNADSAYRAAVDLELAGRPGDAEAAYIAALKKNPELVNARINLGRLVHASNRLREAESHYREALDQEPDNALAAFNLGVVLEDQGRAAAAVDAYRTAIDNDDDHADAHFNLARLLEQSGDRQAALRHLARFRRLTT
jgi:tetratricopeptide (TPR) repeat protein